MSDHEELFTVTLFANRERNTYVARGGEDGGIHEGEGLTAGEAVEEWLHNAMADVFEGAEPSQ